MMQANRIESLQAAVRAACAAEGVRECCAYIAFVDGAEMRRVNRENRGVDRETDVLSFPALSFRETAGGEPGKLARAYDPEAGMPNLGDILISPGRAREQAREYGHSVTRELTFLTVHAALHLLGYDHETDGDRQRMRRMEDEIMQDLGISRSERDAALFEKACAMLDFAYAPYSGYKVGACLLSEDGREFTGCNVENASYGATICAERAALAAAVSQGARAFTAIAIAGESGDSWPCGICRQALNEFSGDMRVIVGRRGGAFDAMPLTALLPHSFGPRELRGEGEEENS